MKGAPRCAALRCDMPCCAVPCRAVPCRAVPCRAAPCCAMLHRTVLCCWSMQKYLWWQCCTGSACVPALLPSCSALWTQTCARALTGGKVGLIGSSHSTALLSASSGCVFLYLSLPPAGGKVGLIDYGQSKRLPDSYRAAFAQLVRTSPHAFGWQQSYGLLCMYASCPACAAPPLHSWRAVLACAVPCHPWRRCFGGVPRIPRGCPIRTAIGLDLTVCILSRCWRWTRAGRTKSRRHWRALGW